MKKLSYHYEPTDFEILTEMAIEFRKQLYRERTQCPHDSARSEELTNKISAINWFLNDLEFSASKDAE